MKLSWRAEWPMWLLIGWMFALAALTWPWAPDRIPVHWNVAGEIDRYGGKAAGLLVLPSMAMGIYLLTVVLPAVDPGRANYPQFSRAYSVIRLALVALFAVIYGTVHLWIRGRAVSIAALVPLLVGVLFVVLGNQLGKIRPNWFVGIRTPWTLSSKTAWMKTHRLAGWLFVGWGLAIVATSVLGPRWSLPSLITGAVSITIFLPVYSYLVWRSDPEKIPPAGTLPAE